MAECIPELKSICKFSGNLEWKMGKSEIFTQNVHHEEIAVDRQSGYET